MNNEREWYSFPVKREHNHIRNILLDNSYDVPRWKWLATVLRKLGLLTKSVYVHNFDTYSQVDIRSQDLKEVLYEALGNSAMHRQPDIVYVSREVFNELIKVFDRDLMSEPIGWPVKVLGMQVIFTPYLKQGILPVWKDD